MDVPPGNTLPNPYSEEAFRLPPSRLALDPADVIRLERPPYAA